MVMLDDIIIFMIIIIFSDYFQGGVIFAILDFTWSKLYFNLMYFCEN